METNTIVLILVFLPFIGAILTPLVHRWLKQYVGWFAVAIALICFGLSFRLYPELHQQGIIQFKLTWIPALDINLSFYVSGVSLLFCLIVSGIGTLISAYANYYLSTQERLAKFYAFILFFMGSMLGVVTAGNLILIFVFWEGTSISSFFLIGYWDHRESSVYGARKALLMTSVGALFMLAGLIWLYLILAGQGETSVFAAFEIQNLLTYADFIRSHPDYGIILVLLLLGAFSKSAQFPFHGWLPNAMEAPTPVSAFLHSATMVKAGIFLVAFLYPVMGGTTLWFGLLTGGGLLTMAMGAYLAFKQNDLKALLAYSTISHLGMIMALFGLSTDMSVSGGIFHILNHAAFKGGLFLVVGIIDHETGTRQLNLLSGLRHKMPILTIITGLAALAMGGLPPLNGFLSKEIFFHEAGHYFHHLSPEWIIPIVAIVGSIFSLGYSLLFFIKLFFGPATTQTPKHFHEAPFGMLLPPMLLAGLCVIIGVYPGLVQNSLLRPAIQYLLPNRAVDFFEIHHWHGVNIPFVMTLLTFGTGALIFIKSSWVRQIQEKLPDNFINVLYDKWLLYQEKLAKLLTNAIQSGYLKNYLMFTTGFMAVMIFMTFFVEDGFQLLRQFHARPIAPFEWIIGFLLIIATFLLPSMRKKIFIIIMLSFVGWMVSLLYVIFRAPDLALTQLMIEAVTTVLFLLVFRFLPPMPIEHTARRTKLRNIFVSILVGASIMLVMLIANANRLFESINTYYLENALEKAGGSNVVNVIIVDFRGMDTMFEITVLCISAAAILAMIKIRKSRKAVAS